MADIPYQGFVGGTYGGTSRHLSAEQCINLYSEPTSSAAITPKSALALRHTPGLKRFATAGHGPIRGAFFEPGTERLFVVSGGDVYEITIDGVPTKMGSVSRGVPPRAPMVCCCTPWSTPKLSPHAMPIEPMRFCSDTSFEGLNCVA